MAARNRTWTPEVVRQKIRTSMLINRLQNHVLGRLEMTKTQIQAAAILLRKTLPDMVASADTARPLDRMNDEQLIAAVNSIRGYLATEATGDGTAASAERAALN